MRNQLVLGCLALWLLTSTTACTRTEESPSPPNAIAGNSVAQSDVKVLRTEVSNLRKQVFQLSSKLSRYESLSLDPTEKGYGRIDTTSGFFLISVRDTKPYLDGYRISLAIGNPSSARYDGFKLKLSWQAPFPERQDGESDDQYSKRTEQWSQNEHAKEFTSIETLHPASWNTVSVVISPASAEEVKMLQIDSMETDRVMLADRR
jgi:hypothetical protein